MAVLDVRDLSSPEHPEVLDSLVRLEERIHRRAERGSNPWYDQCTHATMRRVSELSGDPRYARAADEAMAYFLDHCRKENGLPAWGSHIYWNCYTEQPDGDDEGRGPHEILVFQANWPDMYRLRPARAREIADSIWKWHVVDKATGLHNRHDDGRRGCDFAFSGASFAVAFAVMFNQTQESTYLDRAKLIADWHWRHRHPATGLIPDAPCTGNRYDATHSFTNEPGLFAEALLRCYEWTNDTSFRDIAFEIIKSYDRGLSYNDVARKLHVSSTTARAVMKEYSPGSIRTRREQIKLGRPPEEYGLSLTSLGLKSAGACTGCKIPIVASIRSQPQSGREACGFCAYATKLKRGPPWNTRTLFRWAWRPAWAG